MDSASVAAAPVHGGSPGSIISHLSRKAVILHVLDWGLCSFAKDVSSFLKCLCVPWELICGDSCLLRRRKWQPTPVLLPGKFHGWRNLIGYSPWGHRVGHNWVTSLSFCVMPVELGLKSKQNFREAVLCPINQVKPEIFIAASFCSQVALVLARRLGFSTGKYASILEGWYWGSTTFFFFSGSL